MLAKRNCCLSCRLYQLPCRWLKALRDVLVKYLRYPFERSGPPKIFDFWGERRHWALPTRRASSVRFNCRTLSCSVNSYIVPFFSFFYSESPLGHETQFRYFIYRANDKPKAGTAGTAGTALFSFSSPYVRGRVYRICCPCCPSLVFQDSP